MNWKFVTAPLPLVLLMVYSFFNFTQLGDFYFHASFTGGDRYPNGVAFLLQLLAPFMPQYIALLVYTLLVAVILPYILIFQITKNEMASWVYLYGSNIAINLFFLWVAPQATIQLFMLASILFPPFLVVFLLVGQFFHNAWFAGFLLAIAYLGVKKWLA